MSSHKGDEIGHSYSSFLKLALVDFTAGCAGGTASVYVGQPLDTIKVKLQTFPKLYKNGLDCFYKTFKNEGIAKGLYAGTIPSVAAQASENAVLFLAYGMCQKSVAWLFGYEKTSELSVFQNALAGSFAAFFSSFTLCPTELVKCKLQAMNEMALNGPSTLGKVTKVGPWQVTKDILRTEGIQGLYRGLIPTFAREIPGYFFFFGGHAFTSYLLTPTGSTTHNLGAVGEIICGGMAGVCLWTAVFPADVIKSHAQVGTNGSENSSFFETFWKIKKESGISGLYRGLGPTLLRTFPATGALFLAVENTKHLLNADAL